MNEAKMLQALRAAQPYVKAAWSKILCEIGSYSEAALNKVTNESTFKNIQNAKTLVDEVLQEAKVPDASDLQDAIHICDNLDEPKDSTSRDLVRYCPECGRVGAVAPAPVINCCPDGSRAQMVPKAIAEQAHAGFHTQLKEYEAKTFINVWPDGFWCHDCDLKGLTHRSDDVLRVRVPSHCESHEELDAFAMQAVSGKDPVIPQPAPLKKGIMSGRTAAEENLGKRDLDDGC